MKRCALILMLVLLSVCSCTEIEKTPSDNQKNNLSETEKEAVLNAKASENTNVTKHDKVVEFHLENGLPDIGEFTGSLNGSVENQRFFEHPVHEFIPSSEYGRIIPYVADYKDFTLENQNIGMSFPVYGFCNTEGKIITDELYNVVFINCTKTSDGFEYYTLCKDVESDTGEFGYDYEYIFVSADGRWSINFVPVEANGGYIVFRDAKGYDYFNSDCGYVVYSYGGEYVASIENVELIDLYDNGTMSVYNTLAETYDLIDVYGNVVERNVDIRLKYNKFGVAVADKDGTFQIINKNGDILSSDEYNFVKYYESSDSLNGAFIAQLKSSPNLLDVYGMDGNIICRVDTGELYYYDLKFTSDNRILLITREHSDAEDELRILPQSSILKSEALNKNLEALPVAFSRNTALPYFLAKDEENDRVLICDAEGNTVFSEDSVFYSDSCRLLNGGKSLSYLTGDGLNVVEIENGNKLTVKCDSTDFYEFAGDDDRFLFVFDVGEETICNLIYDFRNDTELFSLETCDYIEVINADNEDFFISVCKNGMSTLYDKKLNILLRLDNRTA